MTRYSRNILTLSKEENDSLRNKKVCVIGCGGLGGYIIEMLGRIGVGTMVCVDGDIFEESNLNRQLYSDINNLGKNKAVQASNRMKKINPDITIIPIKENFSKNNYKTILDGCHVAIDALDNIKSRLFLQNSCEELNIALVHGAIAGWYGQVSTILPGDKTLDIIYSNCKDAKLENPLGNPSFTPATVASLEVSETIKILIQRGQLLRKKLLYINLLDNSFEIIKL